MTDRKEYYRAYYKRNAAKKKAYAKRWIEANRERRNAWARKYYHQTLKLRLIEREERAEREAKTRGQQE